jgi:biotin transporter BioY
MLATVIGVIILYLCGSLVSFYCCIRFELTDNSDNFIAFIVSVFWFIGMPLTLLWNVFGVVFQMAEKNKNRKRNNSRW